MQATSAANWTDPVDVLQDNQKCVSYRARLDGDLLAVQAILQPPWHTFVMDNKVRAAEKLAGRQSLGVDLPTEIRVSNGLEVIGPWYQTPPKDFSVPQMRWYSWGYEDQGLFVARIRSTGPGPARIAIQGQACTDKMCKNVDVEISLPLPPNTAAAAPEAGLDPENLVPVRQ